MQLLGVTATHGTQSFVQFGDAIKRLSSEQLASILITNNQSLGQARLSGEQIKASLIQAGLSDEVADATVAQVKLMQATNAQATATQVATGATGGFKAAMVGLGQVMKTHPIMTALTILSVVIPIVTKLVDHFHKTTAELRSDVDNTASEIESLEAELSSTKARISELRSAGEISLVDPEELKRLETENDFLEAQIRLLKERETIEGARLNKALDMDVGKQMSEAFAYGTTTVKDDGGNDIVVSDYITRKQAYERAIAFLQGLNAEKAKYAAMSKAEQKLHEAEILGLDEKAARARAFVSETAGMYAAAADGYVVFDEASQAARDMYRDAALLGTNAITATQTAASGVEEVTDRLAALRTTIEAIKDDSDLLEKALAAFNSGSIDSFLTQNVTKLIEEFPNLRDEIEHYASGLMTTTDLQKAFNAAMVDYNTDTVYEGITAIIDAMDTYGSESNQVLQAVQNLERIIPGLTSVLYDQETGQLLVKDTTLQSVDALYDYAEAAVEAQIVSNALDLSDPIKQFEQMRDAAIEVYGSAKLAMGYLKAEQKSGGLKTYDEIYEEVKADFQSILDGIAAARNQHKTSTVEDAFEQEYNKHKHLVAMEKETLSDFYAWLASANEKYFGENIKYIDNYRKYTEEVFNGLRELAEDSLADQEHQIALWENQGGHLRDIVNTYRDMQDAVHATANEIRNAMRAAGWSEADIENSAIIQSLQNQWWEYEDAVKDVLSSVDSKLEEHLGHVEHEIFLLEQQGEQEDAIIAKYLTLQDKVHAAAEAIRADLRALGYSEEEIAKNGAIIELQKKWWEYNDAIKETVETVREDMHDALEGILELTIDLIKQEKEDEKEALEDQLADYEKIINARKEILRLAKQEEDYADSVGEKTKRLAEIQRRLTELARDDSRAARLEEGALKEEQAKLNKELAKEQADHGRTVAEDALDKELKAFEDTQEKKIDDIDNFLDDNVKIHEAAIQRLDGDYNSFFDTLLEYVKKYTDTSELEFTTMWDKAFEAAKKYGDYTTALNESEKEVDNSTVNFERGRSIVQSMKENADNWTVGDPNNLAGKNMDLADGLRALFPDANIRRDHNGVWWFNDQKLFDAFQVYHEGTASVGAKPTPQQDETFALLQNREMVLTEDHQKQLWQMIKSWAPLTGVKDVVSGLLRTSGSSVKNTTGVTLRIDAPLSLTGDVDDATLRAIQKYPRLIADEVSKQLKKL